MSKLITTDNLAKLSAGLDARYKALINDSVSDMVSGSIDAAQTSILIEVKKQVDEVKEMLGGKSLVYLTQAEYDALPEAEKNDENIVYNITDSESADHEHENLEFLDKITAINITIGNKTQALDFNGDLNFSLEDIGVDNNHKHDEYYTEEEINNVVSSLEALISGKSDTGHNHDDKYYTESEMNEFLSNKASKDHSHDEFNTFATKGEMNSALEGKANKQHEHDEYATKLGLEEELEGVGESINSVSQSVTTLDTTLRGLINSKADSEHNHDNLYYTKSKVDENINEAITNQNNELTAEINRVESMLDGRSIVYITQAEYDTLSDAEKNDNTKTYFITDAEDNHNHDDLYYTEDEINQLLAGKSDLGHNHDDKYYTETEINTMLADKANKTHEHDDLATVDSLNNAVNTINASISGKADKQHEHDEYVTKLGLEEDFESIEESINSVSQSVTALETTLRGEIGKKADSGHNHNDLYLTKEEVSEDINEAVTNSSNVLSAEINRVESMLGGKSIIYITQAEYDALPESEKTNELKTYFVTDADDNHNHDDLYYTEDEVNQLLANKSDLGHNHNDKYYTETEINTMLADKANKTHEHSDLATVDSLNNAVNTINAAIAKKSDNTHKHDGDYYNKTEATTKFSDIEGDITSLGQEITALNTSISSAETRAKSYADQQITALVNSAPKAMDTLGELAKAIEDHQDVYDAYVAQMSSDLEEMGVGLVEAAMELDETLHNIISIEIDNDVKTEKDRAMDAEEALQNAINGKADASHGTHVTYATTAPSAPGTASAGSSSSVARADHVHPAQTTISGNAGSATQLATGRAIKLTGMVSGQATFDGTADATITVSAAKVPKSGDWWSGGFASVSSDGVMEVGKYLDFHNTDTGANDYDVRLQANTSTPCIITLPTSTGTLALKSDKPSEAGVADSVKQPLTVQLNGGSTEGTNKFTFNGSTAKSVNITPSSIGASATGHNHNDSYYTKSQVDTAIAGVTVDSIQAAKKNHTHNQINSRGNVDPETANNRPAVSGLSMSQAYNNGYPTTYGNVMTMKGGGDGQLLIGWSGTSGAHAPAYIRSRRDQTDANWSEWAQIYTTANKPTVDDIGAAKPDNTIVSVSASNGVLTLTRDKRQKCTNLMDGTQIQFPSVSNTEFLEVHLYFKSESNLSILLPDNCKWRVDPNLDAGTSFELIVTWNSMEWLANLIVYS